MSATAERRWRVLVLESDRSNLRMIGIALRLAGYEVKPLLMDPDYADPLVLGDAAAADVVICDVPPPYEQGLSLVADLRASPALGHTPFICVTTGPLELLEKEQKWSPWNLQVLSKPFAIEALLEAVARACREEPPH